MEADWGDQLVSLFFCVMVFWRHREKVFIKTSSQ